MSEWIGTLDCGARVVRTDPIPSGYQLPQYVCPRTHGPFVAFDLVCMSIGIRGGLIEARARRTAREWLQFTQSYPQTVLAITVDGFAGDPRSLWDVPEIVA